MLSIIDLFNTYAPKPHLVSNLLFNISHILIIENSEWLNFINRKIIIRKYIEDTSNNKRLKVLNFAILKIINK